MTEPAIDFADVGNDMGDPAVVTAIKTARRVSQVNQHAAGSAANIAATPYRWREPSKIPQRPWIYGRWFLRGTVACVVAPGGVGKTTLLSGTALALAVGKPLLGKQVWGGRKKVWIWNLEDDMDELSRSIQAAALHYGIRPADIDGQLFVDSAMEGAGLCTAVEDQGQFKLLEPVYDALTAELTARKIDMLVVDPFVSSHEVEENANSKIDKIAKAWGRVAKAANCVIVLVHHTSKAGSGEVTAMSARGAVALINAARSALVINRMEPDQAERLGIPADERRRYVSVQDDKHNRAPAEKADWYRIASVDLGNGPMNGAAGDSIGVAEPWKVPDPFDDITVGDLANVQAALASGSWKEHYSASDWVGVAVADVLGLDVDSKSDKSKIRSLVKTWVSEGALKVVERKDQNRQMKKFVEVGRVVDGRSATPRQGVASQAIAPSQAGATLHPPPLRGGGVADTAMARSEVSQTIHAGVTAHDRHGDMILAPGEKENDPVPGWDDDRRPRF